MTSHRLNIFLAAVFFLCHLLVSLAVSFLLAEQISCEESREDPNAVYALGVKTFVAVFALPFPIFKQKCD